MTPAKFGGDKSTVVEDVAAQTLAPPIMRGESGNANGALQKTLNKGTEHRVAEASCGDTKEQMAADNSELMPPIMHSHGPRDVMPNTNPGKGTEIRPEAMHFGDDKTMAVDNDSLTGADGDDNDVAARIAGKGGFDG